MKQINSFRSIVLDELEHIVFNTTAHNKAPFSPTFCELDELKNYKFTKKYNLIYQNESMESACDINQWLKKQSTDLLEHILSMHKDKFFMLIDHGIFDHHALRQHENCQVWPRKYFAPFLGWTHHGSRDTSVIERERKHWFCSVMARNDASRGLMFDWIIDQGLDKDNKISYLGVSGEEERFLKTGYSEQIISKYRDRLPFNNFEVDGPPDDNVGRIQKAMPLYDCLFNVVMETFLNKQTAYHTEKSLNAVLYGHVPIVMGGIGSMKKMQDMGIIIPDYIQWSIWDDIPDRQVSYCKFHIMQRQITNLFVKHNLNDIAEDWYPYAVRNLNKLKNLYKECAEEEREICRWILTATHNLSNRNYQYLYA